jgi:TetR/AcrR family transcriptional repressor of nem operon
MGRKADPRLRAAIIREAEHILHIRGYHCASLDEIATHCRMTKANLLHHFRSKEDLALAVLDYKIEAYRSERMAPLDCDDDPARAVSALFSGAAGFYRGNGCRAGCFVGNIALEMSDVSDRFRERVVLFFEEWAQRLAASLSRARRRGDYAATLDPRACAEAILALYEGAIMLARSRRDPAVFDRIGRQALALLETHRPDPLRARSSRSARNVSNNGGCHGTQNALRLLKK